MTADPSGRTVAAVSLLRGWIEREARVAAATQPLRRALNQRAHYTDLRGVNHPLSAMSAAEASLVLALLERHAETLQRGELLEHLLGLEENSWEPTAAVEAYGVLAATPAEAWLRQTPLHRALTERTGQRLRTRRRRSG
jgi:hypothetical protein